MPIKYELAPELQEIVNEISVLIFPHVRLDSVVCIRSFGSSSRGTVARCHALGKAMQLAMGRKKGFYVIEVINKRFDKLSDTDKIKTLIHELMHIPKTFGGGFIHHDYVCERNVEREYQRYVMMRENDEREKDIGNDGKEDENINEGGENKDNEKVIKERKWW